MCRHPGWRRSGHSPSPCRAWRESRSLSSHRSQSISNRRRRSRPARYIVPPRPMAVRCARSRLELNRARVEHCHPMVRMGRSGSHCPGCNGRRGIFRPHKRLPARNRQRRQGQPKAKRRPPRRRRPLRVMERIRRNRRGDRHRYFSMAENTPSQSCPGGFLA
jgi:hypothetical protein